MNKIINDSWQNHMPKIEDKTIDLVISDPPYGMKYVSNRRKVKHKAINDDDNLEWLDSWVIELKRVCKKDAHMYIFCSWHNRKSKLKP